MRRWHEERNVPPYGTELCKVDDILPGDTREASFATDSKYPFNLFIYNDEGKLRCYLNRCPHFQIKLNLDPGRFLNLDRTMFMCQHHMGKFRIHDGFCTEGPPQGSKLESVPIDIKEGVAYLGEQK